MTKECKKNNQYLKALKDEEQEIVKAIKDKLWELEYSLEDGKYGQVEVKIKIIQEQVKNLMLNTNEQWEEICRQGGKNEARNKKEGVCNSNERYDIY